jgi:hypothetical protein
MDNGSIKERYGREAYDVWRSLQKQINKIISKIINFNSSYEFEDYLQEAYIACHKAVCNYNFFKESSESYRNNKSSEKFIVINGIRLKMTNMRIDVYAYWYVQKRLYKIADSGEVFEYRRSRKKLQGEGCRFNSVNIIKDVELMVEDKKNISGCKDFADASFTGFNPEIQELLKEELFRTQDLNGRMKRLL